MNWQPIETAPRDGTLILGALKGSDQVSVVMTRWASGDDLCYRDQEYWLDMTGPCSTYEQFRPYSQDYDGTMTHWAPLPEPPK